jgi:putative ABC transport system permease protein
VLGVVAIPLGFAIGAAFAGLIVAGLSSELFRMPFSLRGRTFAYSALLLTVAGALSSVLVRRKLDQLDLVSVLKTRE